MRDCVCFASFVPDGAWAEFYLSYLKLILEKFSDAAIFVGINPTGSSEEKRWIAKLEANGIKYAFTPQPTIVGSDVSAFQTALKLIKNSGETFRYIWFGHTKGITSHRMDFPKILADHFWSKREHVNSVLEDPEVGSWGPWVTPIADITKSPPVIHDTGFLEKYATFKFPSLPITYMFTHYVIKGDLVKAFLEAVPETFFTDNLVEKGCDIYFFERDFSLLASRYGKWMKCESEITPHYPFTRNDFLNIRKDWIKLCSTLIQQ